MPYLGYLLRRCDVQNNARDGTSENPPHLLKHNIWHRNAKKRPAADLYLLAFFPSEIGFSSRPAYPGQYAGKWRIDETRQLPFGIIDDARQV